MRVFAIMLGSLILLACASRHGAEETTNQTSRSPAQQAVQLYPVEVGDKHGFINSSGKLVIDLPPEVYTVREFSDGLAVIAVRVPGTRGRWGFIDETGKVIIPTRFNEAKPFSEGLAAVVVSDEEYAGGKVGYVDRTGTMVIKPQFDLGGSVSDYSFSQGLAAVTVIDKWGYIDRAGKVLIAPQFAVAFPFSEDRAVVGVYREGDYSGEEIWGYIDKAGRWVVRPRFSHAGAFSEGLAPVAVGEKVGYINKQGQMAIPARFDLGYGCLEPLASLSAWNFSGGLAAARVGEKWGFINQSGEFVIKPAYDCAQQFSEGLAVVGVRTNGVWRFGYVDKTGSIVIKPQLTHARGFSGGVALIGMGMSDDELLMNVMRAREAGKPDAEIEAEFRKNKMGFGYIDKSGKLIWPRQ